jgi:dTDP-4-dehydrorhamnose reductase
MPDPHAGTVLILGGNSAIGSAVARHLRKRGHRVVTTSRRAGQPAAHDATLDLGAPRLDLGLLPSDMAAVVACAAVSGEKACAADPEYAYRVNVENTGRVLGHYRERGARLIFLSTNLVMDGRIPAAPADTPRCPLGLYGAHKAAMEEQLLAGQGNVAVCRLGKVLHGGLVLLRDWSAAFSAGRSVHAFSDYYLSPASLAFTVRAIVRVLQGQGRGIYQITGTETISYGELAGLYAKALGVEKPQIVSGSWRDAGQMVGPAPRYTHLDGSRFTQELGIPLETPESAIAAVVAEGIGDESTS